MKSVLNVGGGSKAIPIPPYYAGWQHHLLDIDPACRPDVVMDARQLQKLAPAQYDAIYCSHNLEHYHRADGAKVIAGFHHVLKEDGFVEVRVPDILAVIKHVVAKNLDVDDQLYVSPSGPIMVRDVFYGYSVEIERKGNDFYAHKTGFSPKSLVNFFSNRGFQAFALASQWEFEIIGYFFKKQPTPELWSMLGLKPNTSVTGPAR